MPLRPGDRIDVKRRIARTLGQQGWGDIDLTLDEFGLPSRDEWSADIESYVLEMLRHASDEDLVQLDAYLHPKDAPTAQPQPDSFDDPWASPWSGQGFRLFLSHIHEFREHAGAIRRELATRSVDAFVAHDSIEPTEDWKSVILNALKTCDGCLALLSPGFKESSWTDQEIGFCIARELLVIPVNFGLNPYGFLGSYQAFSVKAGHTEVDIALGVFELLVRKQPSRDAMARALVARWVNTSSYDAARANYSFLKTIPRDVWTHDLVDQVWEARNLNPELRHGNINWTSSDTALERLFADLQFQPPERARLAPGYDDDIPF